MICRKKRMSGFTLVEIIISITIIAVTALLIAKGIQMVNEFIYTDRMQIQSNLMAQNIIEELQASCAPEVFVNMNDFYPNTNDFEAGATERKFPSHRATLELSQILSGGQRRAKITIFWKMPKTNTDKKSEYHITLVKNSGLLPEGIITGRVINFVTERGIPDVTVVAPGSRQDGFPSSGVTDENGYFRINKVKVGPDILITISKLGSHPNDYDYRPGYYFDPDMIDENTLQPHYPRVYDNLDTANDKSALAKEFDIKNGVVTNLGDIYLCPLAVVRGWVRADENDPDSGVEYFRFKLSGTGDYNTQVLERTYRNSMHPYHTMGVVNNTADTASAFTFNDSVNNYHVTTIDRDFERIYNIEGKPVKLVMRKGDFIFFNIRPNSNTHQTHLKPFTRRFFGLGRSGSHPSIQRTDPRFAWGYVWTYFNQSGTGYHQPQLQISAKNCFDPNYPDGFGPDIRPLFREQLGHHNLLPVDRDWDEYLYLYRNAGEGCVCHPENGGGNTLALAPTSSLLTLTHRSPCPLAGTTFTQHGWDNYETLKGYGHGDKYPTCFVARRKGGIEGQLKNFLTNQPISNATVRTKVWTTDRSVTTSFASNCIDFNTNHSGFFGIYNIMGECQQYFMATQYPIYPFKTGSPPAIPNWQGYKQEFIQASINDQSEQSFAVLRITAQNYVPALIRPGRFGIFDHTDDPYPAPSWHANMTHPTNHGITDFGTINLISDSVAVRVRGRIVRADDTPIANAVVRTRGIAGLSESDDSNLIGLNNVPNSMVQATTNADGVFLLENVMPNFKPAVNNPISSNYVMGVETNETVRRFLINAPSSVILTEISISGVVTDVFTGNPVGAADIMLAIRNPTNDSVLPIKTFTMTSADGSFSHTGSISGLDDIFWYLEHLRYNDSDPYHIGWSNPATRTIDIGEFVAGDGTIHRLVIFAAEKNLTPATTLGGYHLGHTAETPGNEDNGEYEIYNGRSISNIHISLLRKYRYRIKGRIVDDLGIGLANAPVQFGGLDRDWYIFQGHTHTDENGYYGAWDQNEFPDRGSTIYIGPLYYNSNPKPYAEMPNLPLNPLPRTAADNAGAPKRITVYAYAPSGTETSDDSSNKNIAITTEQLLDSGWQDGGVVDAGVIALPILYTKGQ